MRGERAILIGCLLDGVMWASILFVAIWGNSLTLIGETVRGGPLLALEAALLIVLRRINRGTLTDYDYGTRKLEQFGNLIVGVALILGAFWLLNGVADRYDEVQEQSPTGLVFGAIAAVANLGINSWVFAMLWRASRTGTSIIVNGQLLSRLSKVISSALVAVAVIVNAMVGSEGIGHWADIVGTLIVVTVMLSFGVRMFRSALPHLLDRALGERQQATINRVLAASFDRYDELLEVRTRTQGSDAWIEIEVGFAPDRRMGEVAQLADEMAERIRGVIPGAHILVIPRAIG
ncbi:cation diffusion facilitator family transporter [Roseococcus sp. YIM B11640]|uniref:cation diffusion facilitator family transporter n=1 Tax=Roseococcus sp. YIM B11640 TaxID=3133973 RepID=UPI003C7E1A7E